VAGSGTVGDHVDAWGAGMRFAQPTRPPGTCPACRERGPSGEIERPRRESREPRAETQEPWCPVPPVSERRAADPPHKELSTSCI